MIRAGVGISCDADGCGEEFWQSSTGLRGGVTVTRTVDRARLAGWSIGGRTHCPAHRVALLTHPFRPGATPATAYSCADCGGSMYTLRHRSDR